jgi:hypothetical protein
MPAAYKNSSKGSSAALVALALVILAPKSYAASANANRMDNLATSLAHQISPKNPRNILVCNFTANAKDPLYALGTALSERFSADLASRLPHARVLTRAEEVAALRPLGLLSIDADHKIVCKIAAIGLKASAVVTGSFQLKDHGHSIRLSVSAKQLNGWQLGEANARISLDSHAEALEHRPVYDSLAKVYLPGSGGISWPKCQSCKLQSTLFTPQIRGIVLSTITAQGTPEGIVAVGKFTKSFLRNLRRRIPRWRYSPAHLPNGTPVAVHVCIYINIAP